jgi:predicted amidohydrolase YtcJ
VRVGGCKLTIDGSPQGFTALRDRPYYDPVGAYPPGYSGYAAITMEQVRDAVDWCTENGFQILVHSNGEGASDMLIAALGRGAGEVPRRRHAPVLVHGQFLREDQVDSYKQAGRVRSPCLSDAHLLLGRLASRAHGRPGQRRQHLAHGLVPSSAA